MSILYNTVNKNYNCFDRILTLAALAPACATDREGRACTTGDRDREERVWTEGDREAGECTTGD